MPRGRSRANGEGSCFRLKNGRWIGRVSIPGTGGTKRKSVSGKTRREAEEKMQRLRAEVSGLTFTPQHLTFGEHLDNWLTSSAKHEIKNSTYIRYEGIIRLHLKPTLGQVKLKNLTAAHLVSLYGKKMDEGLASGTVRQIHAVAGRSLKQARRWGLISSNPAEDADAPRLVPTKESKALTREDSLRLLERILAWRPDRYALFLLAVTTGMRQGEILALSWKNVDLDRGEVRVTQTVRTWTVPPVFGTPKGGKPRTVKLTTLAINALRIHKKQQNEERLKSRKWKDRGLVFTGPKGDVIRRSVLHQSFVRFLKREGFPELTFHELRHTCASLLLGTGVDIRTTQQLLGHSDVKITLGVYSHVSEKLERSAADKMDELLSEG